MYLTNRYTLCYVPSEHNIFQLTASHCAYLIYSRSLNFDAFQNYSHQDPKNAYQLKCSHQYLQKQRKIRVYVLVHTCNMWPWKSVLQYKDYIRCILCEKLTCMKLSLIVTWHLFFLAHILPLFKFAHMWISSDMRNLNSVHACTYHIYTTIRWSCI